MKKLFLLIAVVAMALPFVSCLDEPVIPTKIEFAGGNEDLSLNFPCQGTAQSVVFSSNYDWTATPSDEWIKVSPENGKAGEKCEIAISLDTNDTYEKRSGSIVISAQELNVILTVSQEQNNAIILSTPTVNLPQAGGAFTVKLKANIDYEYEIKADWIKKVETRALTEHSLRFEAEANPSFDKRVGEIIIKGDGFSEKVSVTQAQTAFISLSTTEQSFDNMGGTFAVEVEHSVDYDVKISANWVTQIESRAIETSTLRFAVAENTTYGERKATITITGGDVSETITVIQEQNNAIILSTPTVNLPQAGGAFTVKLKANIDYEYEIKADWIKKVETRALTEHSLRFEAEANPSFDKRVGEIIIKGDGFSKTVTVAQAQTNILTLSTTSQNFACGGGEFSVEVQHNIDYKVEISDSWVTQIESRAVTTSTLHFVVAENTTYEKRDATITISGEGVSETITIKQDEFLLPYNQLRYTTINGDVLPLNDTSAFGANITSHTYLNGEGIITFDAPITSIGDKAFEWCAALKSITVPDSVTSIGKYAFSDCSSLASVTIGNGVTSIGKYAFSNCSGLTSITIPGSVTSIGIYAFSGCTSLTSVTIPDNVTSIGGYAFYGCSSLASVTIPNSVTDIGNYAFYGCTGELIVNCNIPSASSSSNGAFCSSKFTKVTIGDGVTSIGYAAFSGCTSLTSVTIPDSVISIGSYAFSGCTSLTSVTIGNSVTSIGGKAFYNCSSLTGITIPNSATSIGSYAFYGCSSLASVTIPNSVTSIREYTFSGCTSLKSVTIGNSVTSIGNSAFESCAKLTSITIPDSVTSIGGAAFEDCTSLKSATIGNGVTSIGGSAFFHCSMLRSVTISDSVTFISEQAFYQCHNLEDTYVNITDLSKYCASNPMSNIPGTKHLLVNGTEITELVIPNSVTSIGSYAFESCAKLTSITIPDSVTSIGERAFINCSSLASVTIGNGVTSIGERAFINCSSLASVTIGNGVTSIGEYAFYNCSGLTSVTIPDGVTSIGYAAFSGCSSLTSVTIGIGVTSIEGYAFSGCTSLTSVTIPDSVTSIGGYAFSGCTSLTSVTIGIGVTSIGEYAFRSGGPIELIINSKIVEKHYSSHNFPCSDSGWLRGIALTKLTIGNNITSIGSYAFSSCTSLTSITIPDSVTSIGEHAFSDCSGLTSITIPNSVTSIGRYTFGSCSKLKEVYCKSTVPPSLGSNVFNGNATARVIYVPANSVSRYQTNWSSYKFAITYEGGPLPLKVGDLVSKNGATGIVCYATDSALEIVSVEETSTDWASAKTWCSNYGSGWSLPSTSTLESIYSNKSTINSTLSANGYITIGTGSYWSSDEYSTTSAYYVRFETGTSSTTNKSNSRMVRAVFVY